MSVPSRQWIESLPSFSSHAERGYSLLELLIVIAIISVTLVFSVPSVKHFYAHAQDNIMSSQLLHAIHRAQMEAIMRRETVVLAKYKEGWQKGYTLSSDVKMLYSFSQPKNNGILYWRAFPLNNDVLQFTRTGMPRAENGTFWYCSHHATKPSWAIVVNQSGRARLVYPDKWGNIASDNPLLC